MQHGPGVNIILEEVPSFLTVVLFGPNRSIPTSDDTTPPPPHFLFQSTVDTHIRICLQGLWGANIDQTIIHQKTSYLSLACSMKLTPRKRLSLGAASACMLLDRPEFESPAESPPQGAGLRLELGTNIRCA
jgi:hypothetical protein